MWSFVAFVCFAIAAFILFQAVKSLWQNASEGRKKVIFGVGFTVGIFALAAISVATAPNATQQAQQRAGDTYSDMQWQSLKGEAARSHAAAEAGQLRVDIAHGELDLAQSRLRQLQGR